MKQYIKSLAALLLMSVAFVSCNNTFDDDDKGVNYPATFELGRWTHLYEAKGNTYIVNLTVNEAGDTICDVSRYSEAFGANVIDGGKVTYDPRTGVIKAEYENSLYDAPALVSIALQKDLNHAVVSIYTKNGDKLSLKDTFTAQRTNDFSVLGDWNVAGGTLSLNIDGTASYLSADGESSEGTWTFENGNGEAKLDNGTTFAMALNDKGQMHFTNAAGEVLYASHIMTQPKNDWYDFCEGTYTSWLFGDIPGEILEYSPSRKMARINNWINQGSSISFYWNIDDAEVTPAEQTFPTAYTHVQQGQTLGEVHLQPVAIDAAGHTMIYEEGVFYIGASYIIPGVGSFGADMDYFVITERF